MNQVVQIKILGRRWMRNHQQQSAHEENEQGLPHALEFSIPLHISHGPVHQEQSQIARHEPMPAQVTNGCSLPHILMNCLEATGLQQFFANFNSGTQGTLHANLALLLPLQCLRHHPLRGAGLPRARAT